jgi:hypothetical protein
MPIKWRGTSRRPIPANWHSIGQRSSPYHLACNRNAAHPVNAILNYGYAGLESEIRIKAISDGYDPTIGIMHEGSDGSSKFIFDLMEAERPKVDHMVLDFVRWRRTSCEDDDNGFGRIFVEPGQGLNRPISLPAPIYRWVLDYLYRHPRHHDPRHFWVQPANVLEVLGGDRR